MKEWKEINHPKIKKDAVSLLTGKPVYTQDLAPANCLIVKAVRSPYAHAMVRSVKTDVAKKIPGIECIITADDVPKKRYTTAGQTYPELSPYDKYILDTHIRYVGDPVALVAGKTETAVDKAIQTIRVEYDVLEPLLDFTKAIDNDIIVHPEGDWTPMVNVGGDNKRNIIASGTDEWGDVDAVLAESDVIVDETYHTKQVQQCMMETFRAFSYTDTEGRLTVVSSTQVPFHIRRIVANALGIPKSQIRVIKPRIGGGFGAKQTAVVEVYPAFITHITGKPALMIYSREESMTASAPRHEAAIHVRVGASKDGIIRGISLHSLWNGGAYGDHSPTTVTLSGHKSIPLYNQFSAYRFQYESVYTNTISAGAYRGYGATQGIFALESAINELAAKLHMDPAVLRLKNIVHEGEVMPAYFNDIASSCTLDACIQRVKEMSGWEADYPCKKLPNGHIRSLGMSLSMQGSSIAHVDVASATIKVNDDGFYTLSIGASDMGTGCDTILAQIAAECLQCSADNIITRGVDTDTSPYDSGSYASSTTYLTGKAVELTCQSLIKRMKTRAAIVFGIDQAERLVFTGVSIDDPDTGKTITIKDLGNGAMWGNDIALESTESHHSPTSPPPYMASVAILDIDPETGHIEVVDFASVVDCGTVINPALAKVQVEGGIVQGIGMALTENVQLDKRGRIQNNSFMQYRMPTRQDIGDVRVEFAPSYEPQGPFGAKSIGEIVINSSAPAIADAVYNAVGVHFRELPITAERVYMALKHKPKSI